LNLPEKLKKCGVVAGAGGITTYMIGTYTPDRRVPFMYKVVTYSINLRYLRRECIVLRRLGIA
jgi:hypothetical protein